MNEGAEKRREALRTMLRLAHTLRYRTVHHLIGRPVVIRSLGGIGEALRGAAGLWAAEGSALRQPTERTAEMALLKYGLIDAELEAAWGALEHEDTLVGLEVMRECGFLPRPGDRWSADDRRDAVGMASILDEEMVGGAGVLKLFLRDATSSAAHMDLFLEELKAADGRMPKLRPGQFPMVMMVDDACVTNSSCVWFAKHFYL